MNFIIELPGAMPVEISTRKVLKAIAAIADDQRMLVVFCYVVRHDFYSFTVGRFRVLRNFVRGEFSPGHRRKRELVLTRN